MEAFYLKIYLFKDSRLPPIKIARNSQLQITAEFMDYTIPDGAEVSAFATGLFPGAVYTQDCTVDGNMVTFTPMPGFFVKGKNILQYKINNGVIPLAIDVSCEINIPDTGDGSTPEQVLPYVTRAENAAVSADKSAKAAQDALDKTAEIAVTTPQIGENGNWFVFDAGNDSYIDSGVRAQGESGLDGHTPVYGVDYGTPEQIAGIAQQAAEILQPEVNQIKDDLSDNAEADAETRRKLDYLWKLNQGISYQFETDDAAAYSKIVPSGAKAASVGSVGGKTVVWNQYVKTPRNETVKKEYGPPILSIDNGIIQMTPTGTYEFVSFGCISDFRRRSGRKYYLRYSAKSEAWSMESIYAGLPILQGLWVTSAAVDRNTTDWQTKSAIIGGGSEDGIGETVFSFRKYAEETNSPVYVRDIVVVDLTLMLGLGNEPTTTDDPRIAWIEQYAADHQEYNDGDLVSADVDSVKYNDAVVYEIPEAVRNLPGYGWSAGDAYNSIERTETGWQYVQRVGSREYLEGDTVTDGVTSYYALDSHIITDITDLMAEFPVHFEVEAGGAITMENAAKLPVPRTEKYLISLAEVNL